MIYNFIYDGSGCVPLSKDKDKLFEETIKEILKDRLVLQMYASPEKRDVHFSADDFLCDVTGRWYILVKMGRDSQIKFSMSQENAEKVLKILNFDKKTKK